VFFTFSTAFTGQSGAKAAHTPNLLWFHRIAQKKKELRIEKKGGAGIFVYYSDMADVILKS